MQKIINNVAITIINRSNVGVSKKAGENKTKDKNVIDHITKYLTLIVMWNILLKERVLGSKELSNAVNHNV